MPAPRGPLIVLAPALTLPAAALMHVQIRIAGMAAPPLPGAGRAGTVCGGGGHVIPWGGSSGPAPGLAV